MDDFLLTLRLEGVVFGVIYKFMIRVNDSVAVGRCQVDFVGRCAPDMDRGGEIIYVLIWGVTIYTVLTS